MLHGAAAADAEMFADRRFALMARFVDADEMPPVGMAVDAFDRHEFARQSVGDEYRPNIGVGDAVAAMAEAGDGELFGHAVVYRTIVSVRNASAVRRASGYG